MANFDKLLSTYSNFVSSRNSDYRECLLSRNTEILQTFLISRFAKVLVHAQALQISHLDACKQELATVKVAFGKINASADQDLFIDHHIRPFVLPADWTFEPCSIHYDTASSSIL
jgi:hypothetical protein